MRRCCFYCPMLLRKVRFPSHAAIHYRWLKGYF
jgi:hypothetical protein